MKLFTKICISAFVHMIWFLVIYKAIYEAVGMMSHEPIYGVLLSGEFMFVVYPVVANLIVYLVPIKNYFIENSITLCYNYTV